MKIWILGVLLAMVPFTSHAAEEITDTGYLKAFYCYQLAESPRLAIDLSNEEKQRGVDMFVRYLVSRGLELPKGDTRKDLQYKFSMWVMGRMKADDEKIIGWFRSDCLQPSS